jgi:threonine aldolase
MMEALKMKETITLADAYKKAQYQVIGHSRRNIQILKDALAELDGQLESDMYGKGELIEGFQDKMAKVLGKEAAVFFPSGTMAQQIALRIWCDQKELKKVAYHPLCHLEIHEEDGLKRLHHIESVLLADPSRLIELNDVLNMKEEVACLLLELPQREIGGQLPSYETLEAISAFCRDKGIKLHLDGARLFEILPYYQKTAADICGLFDSVYVSFYKGIGGIAGAILAGSQAFIQESIVWKRRHGGDLISLYPYIVSADHYYNLRIDKMEQYYEEAKELAGYFNKCRKMSTNPLNPVSNMFHVHVESPKDKFEPLLIEIYEATGIGFTGKLREISDQTCSFEVNIGDQYDRIPKASLRKAFEMLDSELKKF